MNIVYSLTRNLYPVLLPSIMSVLEHNPDAKIYIMAETKTIPYDLPKQCEVIHVNPFDYLRIGNPNASNQFSFMAQIRSATSKYIHEDRVIQLDVDTIVTDSLQPMWDMDLGTDLCAMCNEHQTAYRPYGDKYYNAGVMLIDLKRVREEKVDDAMIELLNRQKLPYIDQDAWNIVAKGRIKDLPIRFNESFATGITDAPAVVHYAGYAHHWLAAPRHEYYARYKRYERF